MSAPVLVGSSRPRVAVLSARVAALLSAALVAAAVVDRVTGQGLADHAAELYAPDGEDADPNLLYGLVVTVGAVGVGLWLLVARAVRKRRWYAPVLAVAVVVTTATLAVTLLVSAEYGERIFPTSWGLLALLGPAAGAVTIVSLLAERRAPGPGPQRTAYGVSRAGCGSRAEGPVT
jgi:hypothetical protein